MDGEGTTETLAHFATGLQVTTVVRTPDGQIWWRRRPGPDADTGPGGFRLPPGFASAAAAASGAGIGFVPARHRGPAGDVLAGFWEWQAPSAISAALLISSNAGGTVLPRVMAALGERLRVLHTTAPAIEGTDEIGTGLPSWLRRLRTWMASGTGTRAARRWHQTLREALGVSGWSRLEEWIAAVPGSGPGSWTHGFLTLGSVIVAIDPAAPSAVLSGPDVAGRPREVDLGCVLGELAEFRDGARRHGTPVELVDVLRTEFLRSYDDGWGTTLAARLGALRIAVHAHDFAAFVGWADELHDYASLLQRLLATDAEEILAPELARSRPRHRRGPC